MAHNFKELKVWKDSMAFAKTIFFVTQSFPNEEKFGMVAQMRKCAVSVPSNIAEGSGRTTDKEFARFLDIALGSAYELETQILLSHDFEYISAEKTLGLIECINTMQKMLVGLRGKISSNTV